ncbi:arginine repressor [Secundilactobacillus kimchicus]|nr:arginine repressor [Secundilactobacillus kimchicus]MBT9671936.1 arginine repressor [Secundilactobacillus kimchicus]
MSKEKRQEKIEQLLNHYKITTQDELRERLQEAGIKATQATVSRDIKDMQIVKQQDVDGNLYYVIYKAGNQNEIKHLYRAISETVTKLERVSFINIVHTLPSYANMLAAIIDDLELSEISGTLAGHDTIVMFCPDEAAAKRLYATFHEHLSDDILTD